MGVLSESEISDIVSDLIRLKPKGPKGIKVYYHCDTHWDYDVDRHKKIYTPSLPFWGYCETTLFGLGLHTKSAVNSYIRKRDFDNRSEWNMGGQKGTLTRRTNRIWQKLEEAVKNIKKVGMPGIYKIEGPSHSYSTFGHIYAESLQEAQQNAALFFGYLIKDSRRLTASFVKIGTIYDLAEMNAMSRKLLETDILRANRTIEREKLVLESLNSRLSTLSIVENQQTSVEMAHLDPNLKLPIDK